jgi:hypothetical protein
MWLCVVLLKRISGIFLWGQTAETLLEGFKGLNAQISVNILTMWHNVYQNHTFCILKKKVARTFPAEGLVSKFSLGELGRAIHRVSFCLRLKAVDPCRFAM